MTAAVSNPVDLLDHKRYLDYEPGLWRRLATGLAREQNWSHEYAEQVLNESIRYLMFCGQHPGEEFACSDIVDKANDYFILRTLDNHRFCDVHFGFFIHHIPLDEQDDVTSHHLLYRVTLAALEAEGHSLDPAIWTDSAGPCANKTGVYDRCKNRGDG